MQAIRRRWSDNDKTWGPFLYSRSRDSYRPFAVVLDSGDGDEHPGCHVRLSAFGHTLIVDLPAMVKPWRRWVDLSKYEWATPPNKGYWDMHSNQYGFSYQDGFLQVFLGAQTHDSETTQNWCTHLPWTQWRFHRMSFYDVAGAHYWTQMEAQRKKGGQHWAEQMAAEKSCPSVSFVFKDYDGQEITAVTRIWEREYRFGEKWFKWLSWFRKPMVKRSLDLSFSSEVGPEKGSWKGGTTGHGIEMLPGELHESAFRRYCLLEQHGRGGRKTSLTFVGVKP